MKRPNASMSGWVLLTALGCGPQVANPDSVGTESSDADGTGASMEGSGSDSGSDSGDTSIDDGSGEPEPPQTWCMQWRESPSRAARAVDRAIANLDGGLPELWTITSESEGDSLYVVQRLEGDALVTIDTFTRPGTFYAFGDVDGDGTEDALVVVTELAQMGWLRGNANGRLDETVLPLDLPLLGQFATIGDYDGDGLVDALRRSDVLDALDIFVGAGDGTFTLAGTLDTGVHNFDFEAHSMGSGQTLLVLHGSCIGLCDGESKIMLVELGSDGTTSVLLPPLLLEDVKYIDASDRNGDGLPDLLLERVDGDSGVRGIAWYDSPGYAGVVQVEPSWVQVVGDVDLDGTNDVMEAPSGGDPSIRFGTANEGLSMAYALQRYPHGKVAEADLDGDGWLDFVLPTFDAVVIWSVVPCER